MAILQWNIRGYRANREELLLLTKDFPSIVCLQETLVSDDTNMSLSGYSEPIRKNIKRGNAVFIKSGILFNEINITSPLEAVAVRVSLQKALTICSLYLSPSEPVSKVELLNLTSQLPEPFLIVGDLNGHSVRWGSESTNTQGKVIEDFIDDLNLCILNSGAHTYIDARSGKPFHIDVALIHASLGLDLRWSVHDDLCGSDHFPTFINFELPEKEDSIPRWKFNRADWDRYSKLTNIHIKHDICSENDPALALTNLIIKCAEESIPKSVPKNKRPTFGFDKECHENRKKRLKAQRYYFTHPATINGISYKKIKAYTRYIIKQKRKTSWRVFCSKLGSKTPSKKVYNVMRKIKGKHSKDTIKCLKKHGNIITDKKEVANILAATISENSSSDHYCDSFREIKAKEEQKDISFDSNNSEVYNLSFNLLELKDALLKSNDSASGPDDIHYQLLTHLHENALKIVLMVFNHIWSNQTFPDSWKKAIIIPIPKPGKDHSDPGNYRPIALTSCLCKTMERMVYNRMMWHLESIKALDKVQCGFRKNRSTVDHLVRFETFVRNALVNGDQVVSVLFDLEKAYDTTWKFGILKDLKELGFVGNLPIFVLNFLEERKFQVRVGNTFSDPFDQEMGVPQGSILSPLLFNIKINKIASMVKNQLDKSLFVDDFSISAKGKSLNVIEKQLQESITKVEKWVEENGFKFSTSKTECIHFHRKRSHVLKPCLSLKNGRIKVSKEVKFLGIIFDEKLTFLPHIKYLRKSCQKGLNCLKIISHTDWGADKETLLKLYRSLVRSKLDYGCIVYGSARKSYLDALDPIHHQGLRICLGAFRTSPKESLYAKAGEPPLSLRRLKLMINYVLKLKSDPSNPCYSGVFKPKFSEKFKNKPKEIPPLGLRIAPHLEAAGIDLENVYDNSSLTKCPSWKIVCPIINFELTTFKKENTPSAVFTQRYLEEMEGYKGFVKFFTDGSKKEEMAAAGIAEELPNRSFKTYHSRLKDFSSIYTAELIAILVTLKMISRNENNRFLIATDSLSALQALSSRNFSHVYVKEILDLYSELVSNGKYIAFIWVPSHIGIKGNEEADKAAKRALNIDFTVNFKIPFSDFRSLSSIYCHQKWQESWSKCTENKLFKLQPELNKPIPVVSSTRKEESILCRLQIGHTYVTHGFLLRNEDPPWCHGCDTLFTVKHFLSECNDLIEERGRFFGNNGFLEIFKDPVNIFKFLEKTRLYYKI